MSLGKMSSRQLMSFILSKPRHSGFSILQVAVLLAVAGIVLVTAIPGGKGAADDKKRELTQERMKAIEEATTAFMVKNARRPCPADGTLAVTNASFGMEFNSGACDPASNPNFDYTGSDSDGNPVKIVAGIPPVRALGLADEYAFDGWGRRMTYIVDQRATNAGTFSRMQDDSTSFVTTNQVVTSCFDLQTQNRQGGIKIYASYDDYTTQIVKDTTMWALISYGKYGHGAFLPEGSSVANRFDARGGSTTAFPEAAYVNAFVDATGGSAGAMSTNVFYGDLIQQNTDTATKYDNIVWYKQQTKNICALGRNALRGTYMNLASAYALPSAAVSVASGDINGDGLKDLVIGNFSTETAYVLFGSKIGWPVNSAISRTDLQSGIGGFTITNASLIVAFMGVITAVGDINDDGYDDIALGATAGVLSSSGNATVIVFGGNNETLATRLTNGNLSVANLDGQNGLVLFYENLYDTDGVGGAEAQGTPGPILMADVTGDGKKDLIMSKFFGGNGIHVIYNRTNWADQGCDLTATGFNIGYSWDISYGNFFNLLACGGSAVDTSDGYFIESTCGTCYADFPIGGGGFGFAAGDVDRDGDDDLVLGEYRASGGGKIIVLRMPLSPVAGATPRLSFVDITGASWFTGASGRGRYITAGASDYLGTDVAVKDTDNDGYADIIATTATRIYGYKGSALNSGWTTGQPAAINLTGTAANYWAINIDTDRPTWLTVSPASGAWHRLKSADITGDGRADLILGIQLSGTPSTCLNDVSLTTGATYVINQPAAGFTTGASAPQLFRSTSSTACDSSEINTTNFPGSFRIDGYAEGAYSHIPVIADVNGDGKEDIAIGSTGYDTTPPAGTTITGRVDILWGRKNTAWETLPGKNVYQLPTSLP